VARIGIGLGIQVLGFACPVSEIGAVQTLTTKLALRFEGSGSRCWGN
jgi:hypothetical protein